VKFSIIVPVFNRPDEVRELLESLSKQTEKNFELVIVEDGSTEPCKTVSDEFADRIEIQYFFKKNEKPAIARNFGAKHAKGDYFLFFDSDCIIPEKYFEIITKELTENYVDAYGGPDAAHPQFNTTQKAISYSMTSFFTTGGIRGGGEKIDKFYPRSFNMGISRTAFEKIGGFPVTGMHPGEDMVFSVEIVKQGFRTRLIRDAYVFHKRRNTLKTFYKQVFRFGKTRVVISKFYPETFKIFFWFPTLFALGTLSLIASSAICLWSLMPILFYALAVFTDSVLRNKSLDVGAISVLTSFIQLFGYGFGFLTSWCRVNITKTDEYKVFEKGFYRK